MSSPEHQLECRPLTIPIWAVLDDNVLPQVYDTLGDTLSSLSMIKFPMRPVYISCQEYRVSLDKIGVAGGHPANAA